MTEAAATDFVLTVQCPDRPGIVHAVSGVLVEQTGNIVQSQQYGDPETGRFFLRMQFQTAPGGGGRTDLRHRFGAVANHAMTVDRALSPSAPVGDHHREDHHANPTDPYHGEVDQPAPYP